MPGEHLRERMLYILDTHVLIWYFIGSNRLHPKIKEKIDNIRNKKEREMKFKLTEELWKEGNMYVSYCPELDIASCGETVEQAKKNLREVILINLEEAQKMGTLDKLLEEAGFDKTQSILTLRKELVGFTPIEVAL